MYAAGKLPDHVTRYNHKDSNRWMMPIKPRQGISWGGVLVTIIIMVSGTGMITLAAMLAQMA